MSGQGQDLKSMSGHPACPGVDEDTLLARKPYTGSQYWEKLQKVKAAAAHEARKMEIVSITFQKDLRNGTLQSIKGGTLTYIAYDEKISKKSGDLIPKNSR